MRGRAVLLVVVFLAPLASGVVQAQRPVPFDGEAWPGEPIDNHVHMTWAALTLEVNGWADDHPDIVDLMDIGTSELGRTLWVVRLSDWSMDTKPNGSAKEIVYIDGGHHGNEYLGTALAYLTAKFYINEWVDGNQEAIDVLQHTELHILIMLNPDGNDMDTRWNVNQVDLNRNYDHYWNTCPTTQPGSSAFSESETMHNSDYMNAYVTDADLYVTMHTGVWIMLYPWGKWADQPPDWELFWGIREDVHATVSDIPIQNANQGLYPNCGTSRDYGYGVMGFPTFTFETDDEQFVPGTFESLHSRLSEELDVMRFLINNVWYWRARLDVASLQVSHDEVALDLTNHGYASTTNASLEYHLNDGTVAWASPLFNVNATASKTVQFPFDGGLVVPTGQWNLNYQKRVIDASTWVNETVPDEVIDESGAMEGGAMPLGTAPLLVMTLLAAVALEARNREEDDRGQTTEG